MMTWLCPHVAHASLAPEEEELRDLADTVHRFEESSLDYREQSRKVVQYRFQQNHDALHAASEQSLQGMENDQRDLRSKAIAKFENFLKLYPDVDRYAPDAMFRLSELYFERSYEDYSIEHQNYEKALATWDADAGAPEPIEPTLHYEPTIALMQRVITEFPNYRLVDGAYYLMGYCLNEQGEEERAVDTFRELVARRPDSKFSPEVWTRIGEFYFNANQLDRALQAYSKVLIYPDSPFYDKALYKLAWTHYRLADPERSPQEFQNSVDTFVRLLDFNEQSRKAGAERGGELRDEAFQYIAISYAEEHWGSFDKLRAYFSRIGGRPYERDVMMALADTYFDETRFNDAMTVYRSVLAKDPSSPDAPLAQDKLIASLERQRDFEHAAQERDILTAAYSENSPWYRKNKSNTDAVTRADKLVGKALYSAALFHHRQAQTFKQQQKNDLALPEYVKAAASYGSFLRRYPGDKQAYDLTYAYADCQFYAQNYESAADAYAQVRDSNEDNKLQEDAAFSTIVSYADAIKKQEEGGKLAPQPVLKSTDRKPGAKVVRLVIPTIKKKFVEASDRYALLLHSNDKAPKVLYSAAEVYYTYDHFDEARTRFQAIIDAYPNDDVARFASNLMIESYLTQENYGAVEKFARALLDGGTVKNKQFADDLVKFKSGAMFKLADAFAVKGDQEKAADMYLKLIDENPRTQFADLALNNAAVAYEKVNRFDSASKMYERLVNQYPKSKLADNALFRVGLNAGHFFNFDKAIHAYLQLETQYPKSPSRADAIYNAALSLENTQDYDRSAQMYQRYCKLFPTRADAPQVCFRAGAVLEKTGQWQRVINTYENFIHAYHKDTKNRDRLLEANLRVAKAYEKLNKPAMAHKFYQAVAQQYKVGAKDSKSAPYAAEAEFNVVDGEFGRFRAVKIQGPTKAQKASLTKKATELKKVEASYSAILKFKQIDWTLASLYRIGQLYQDFAENLENAPCPPDVKAAARKMGATPEEVCDEYRAALEEKAGAISDKAVGAYETTVNKAREFQVINKWTKQTLEALNKLRRADWPLQKEAKQYVDTVAIVMPAAIGAPKAAPPSTPAPASAPAPAPKATAPASEPSAGAPAPSPPPSEAAPTASPAATPAEAVPAAPAAAPPAAPGGH